MLINYLNAIANYGLRSILKGAEEAEGRARPQSKTEMINYRLDCDSNNEKIYWFIIFTLENANFKLRHERDEFRKKRVAFTFSHVYGVRNKRKRTYKYSNLGSYANT